MVKSAWRSHLWALLGYTVLTVTITWPLLLHIGTALPGEGTDSWQYLWNFWWFDQALFESQTLYFTPAQYYPGTSLLFHTLSPLHSLLGLPARLLCDALQPGRYLAAYNFGIRNVLRYIEEVKEFPPAIKSYINDVTTYKDIFLTIERYGLYS